MMLIGREDGDAACDMHALDAWLMPADNWKLNLVFLSGIFRPMQDIFTRSQEVGNNKIAWSRYHSATMTIAGRQR